MFFTETIGESAVNGLACLGSLVGLAARAARALFVEPFRGRRLRLGRVVHQAMAIGVEAVPIVSLISFFVGTILALQGAYQLRRLGAMQLVANAVAIIVTRELGPLMTAIIVIGRSGSAFAAEIGTMKVNEELDALETMALDPEHFLVAPKFLAMALMMPCLTTWADLMGVCGGGTFGVLFAGFTWGTYFRATLQALALRDIITGLIKSVLFGLVITAVGCQEGLSAKPSPEQVGLATTSAVVKSIFLVIGVDLIFTTFFYFTAPQ
jgi:phospholipid/cholesterol/gamma-HCH transport system permease protein